SRWSRIAAMGGAEGGLLLMRGLAVPRSGLVAVAIGIAAAGCATAPPAPDSPPLVWPPPPAPPRIEFVQSLATGQDPAAARPPGGWRPDLLGGSRPTEDRLAEPMGVAVSDDGTRVYVADPAQHAVFVFDLAKRRVRRLGAEPIGRPLGLALDGEERVWVV